MTRRVAFTIIIGALLCATLATSTALAKKGPPTPETATNNLSVPTIMIPGSGFTGVTCPGGLSYPTLTPLTGYPISPLDYYFVQGYSVWQSDCVTATSANGRAEWGDNLSGDAKLKAGSPIRVELGLFNQVPGADEGTWADDLSMQGFTVLKLEPSKLDRESAYGTLATPVYDEAGALTGWTATAENLAARIYDAGVTFSVMNVDTDEYLPALGPGSNPTAEINATGKVVYGYNLRVDAAGQYEITFSIPNVNITGVDAGTFVNVADGPDTVSLVINVTAGGGKGGRG